MRRILSLAMIVILSLSLLAGCGSGADGTSGTDTEKAQNDTQIIDADTWDGSVASSFDGGDGSQASPYKIATSEQLAFLANQVSSGIDYSEKYIVLLNNLDLNNIEWSPIGDGVNFFSGHFDGKEHVISNLKTTNAVSYSSKFGEKTHTYGLSGLFSICRNATIKNLNIRNASISVTNSNQFDGFYIGILAGRLETSSFSDTSNISISDSSISLLDATPSSRSYAALCAGGLAGLVSVSDDAECVINKIQNCISIISNDTLVKTNYNGGIIGIANNYNSLVCSDLASYLTVKWPNDVGEHYAGAFGSITNGNNTTKISNVFSKICVNQKNLVNSNYCTYQANAILASCGQLRNNDGVIEGNFELSNLFGYIKPTNGSASSYESIYNLYDLPKNATETNCKGCEELPENHGFDTSIWNVSDPKKPTLK